MKFTAKYTNRRHRAAEILMKTEVSSYNAKTDGKATEG